MPLPRAALSLTCRCGCGNWISAVRLPPDQPIAENVTSVCWTRSVPLENAALGSHALRRPIVAAAFLNSAETDMLASGGTAAGRRISHCQWLTGRKGWLADLTAPKDRQIQTFGAKASISSAWNRIT